MDDNILVSELTVPQFYERCTRLFHELRIKSNMIVEENEECTIEIPETNPLQLFVCNRTSWHIEKAGEGEDSDIFDIIDGPNNYEYIQELRSALDRTFKKLISNSQFNTSNIKLWMAIDKLTDAVHSHLQDKTLYTFYGK